MRSNQGIDNFPTVDATPSKKFIATRLEHKIFKLFKHHQSSTACASHLIPPSIFADVRLHLNDCP
jgi:hypothetical protein